MDARLIDKRIRCPFCGEPMDVVLDMSAGSQSYVEDCQVCCQPMQINFTSEDGELQSVWVDRAG